MNAQRLIYKLKELDERLPQLSDRYKLKYRGDIEPMHPEALMRHLEIGLMVPISRAALLEIIKALEDQQQRHVEAIEAINEVRLVVDALEAQGVVITFDDDHKKLSKRLKEIVSI